MKDYWRVVVYSAGVIEAMFLVLFIATGIDSIVSAFFLGMLVCLFMVVLVIKNIGRIIVWTTKKASV